MSTDQIVHMLRLTDLTELGQSIGAASLESDGFVHCSPDEAAALEVANALYRAEVEPMVALIIDPAKIEAPVRFEAPIDPLLGVENRLFPHVFGPISRSAIIETRYARRDVTGTYVSLERRSPLVESLNLLPHPEGGWFRETWRSSISFNPDGYSGTRAAGTAIYFVLRPGERSVWHRVRSDELWFWHAGLPLALTLGGSGLRPGAPERHVLGGDVLAGNRPQLLVPGGWWQSAEPMSGDADEVLVSCVVSPGFDFADFDWPS